MSEGQSTPFSGELTFAEAVDARLGQTAQRSDENLGAALEDPKPPKASLKEAATDEPEDEPEEGDEPEEESEEDTEEKDSPDSEDESSETEDDDEDEEEEEPEEAVYTLEIDGELHEVTLEELKRGHLRESDYTRKTQDLASERKAVADNAAQLDQALNATAVIMNSALQANGDQLQKFAEINWEQLRDDDPYEYARTYADYNIALGKREKLEQQAGQLVQAQQQMQYESTQKRIAHEKQLLVQAMPDMADVKRGPELMQSIRDYAMKSLKLSDAEVSGITDHRVIVALNKARLYDAMDAKVKTTGAKKRSQAPMRSVKAGSPPDKGSVKSAKVTGMRKTARRTGSVDDAVEALLASRNIL